MLPPDMQPDLDQLLHIADDGDPLFPEDDDLPLPPELPFTEPTDDPHRFPPPSVA